MKAISIGTWIQS